MKEERRRGAEKGGESGRRLRTRARGSMNVEGAVNRRPRRGGREWEDWEEGREGLEAERSLRLSEGGRVTRERERGSDRHQAHREDRYPNERGNVLQIGTPH